jgi:hypothetical protein
MVAIVLGLVALPCFAQPAAVEATAQELFEQGRTLMEEKRYEEACPKLAESYRLDPGGGTLLNLAYCNQQLGKLATAWAQFKQALGAARKDDREDRMEIASKHIEELTPQLSRLTIIVPEEARVEGLVVERDGVKLGRAAWRLATPVDPGAHRIVASAPGHQSRAYDVTLEPASVETVTIEALMPLPPPKPVALPIEHPPPPPEPPPPPPEPTGLSTQATMGYIAIAVGSATGTIGLVFGGVALSKSQQSDDLCSTELCPDTESGARAVELNDQASQYATVANVLGFGGLAVTALGVALVLTASDGPISESWQLRPAPVLAGAGLSLGKAW